MYIDINGEWVLLITFMTALNHFLSLVLLFKMNKKVKKIRSDMDEREDGL